MTDKNPENIPTAMETDIFVAYEAIGPKIIAPLIDPTIKSDSLAFILFKITEKAKVDIVLALRAKKIPKLPSG